MAQFKIKQKEQKVVETATFNKEKDFMVISLISKQKGADGKAVTVKSDPKVVHVIQGKRLIEKGKAEEVKNVEFEKKESTRSVKKVKS